MGVKVFHEPTTNEDLIEAQKLGLGWVGWSPAMLHFLPTLGYTGRDENGVMQGIGCIVWVGRGETKKAIGAFMVTDAFRRDPAFPLIYRRALEILQIALLQSPRVYAEPGPESEHAESFLHSLGFVPQVDSKEWVCDGSVCWRNRRGRGGDRILRGAASDSAHREQSCASPS